MTDQDESLLMQAANNKSIAAEDGVNVTTNNMLEEVTAIVAAHSHLPAKVSGQALLDYLKGNFHEPKYNKDPNSGASVRGDR